MASDAKPISINGGCVCESIRYSVTFPPDHDFANAASTCQCAQCRKNTGSLIFRVHRVPKSAVNYTANSTLKTYSASPGRERGFCTNCGSFLFWQRSDGDYTSLTVGCFDTDALVKYGPLLTKANKHLFCDREIPGVTDHLEGSKFQGDDE